MWCLNPPLSKVSSEKWYCPSCSSENPDQQMGAFTKYMSDFQNEFTEQSFNNPTDYLKWLWHHQEQSIPLKYYYPGVLDGVLPDSFCSHADEIIEAS